MAIILGIDLGTSSVKAMLLDSEGAVVGTAAREYPVDIPRPGWAEQSPELWWSCTLEVLAALRKAHRAQYEKVEAVGFSGQMHGAVLVGEDGKPLRPAILWLDRRSAAQAGRLAEMDEAGALQNRVFPGFLLPSLMWVRENEPEVLRRVHRVLLPKDYLRYRMTGRFGCEYSDASATAAFAPGKRRWAWELLGAVGMPAGIFPECGESAGVAGTITRECAAATGLRQGTPAVYGAGDQQAQSIGNGAVREGMVVCNIGTGGQVAAYSAENRFDPALRTHTFCHAVGDGYTVFGATLCAGMSLNWLKNRVLLAEDYAELSALAAGTPRGAGGLTFLPYLSGERTPYMDPDASGMFFGLRMDHGRGHFARAVMEGVAFALRQSLDILVDTVGPAGRIIASGGAAASPVWLQIQADIFEREIAVCGVREQACLGACILAGLGVGAWPDVAAACARHVGMEQRVYYPHPGSPSLYRERYALFGELYERNRELMHRL